MKIIHAHKYFYLRAGAERYVLSLMRLQEEAGHQVAPFSMHYPKNDPSPWDQYFVSELKTESGVAPGLGALRQFNRAFWSREAYRNMGKFLDVFQPDIVHAHNLYTHLSPSVLQACHDKKVPVVMTVHDYSLVSSNYSLWDRNAPMDLDKLGILSTARTRFIKGSYLATLALEMIYSWHRFRRAYDRYIEQYFAPSNFVRDVLVASGIEKEKIHAIHLPSFVEAQESKRRDKGHVLFMGRLVNYKGIQTLIDAIKKLPGVKLKIAGTGEDENELRAQAADMENVEFLGFVSGKALTDLIARSRVVVVPSVWHEAYGLVVIEAMAQGVPVVVSDRGALPEIVEDGVSGRVFKAGDANDLARILKEFTSDFEYARSLGDGARVRAEQIGSAEDYSEKIITHYKEVIEQFD